MVLLHLHFNVKMLSLKITWGNEEREENVFFNRASKEKHSRALKIKQIIGFAYYDCMIKRKSR